MSRPTRVAMLIQAYQPRVGGAERQLAYITPLLQAHGTQVNIITRRHAGLSPFEVIAGVPVHRLPIPGPKALASMSFTLTALPLLRRLRPDLTHAHELFSPASTAVMARRLFGMAAVVTVHRSGDIGEVSRLRRKFLGAQRMAVFRREVDAFVAVSREVDSELSAAGVAAEKRTVIPNGVDANRFAPPTADQKRAQRAALDVPAGAPVALFAGRLAPEKRVSALMEVWPAVRAAHPDAQLLVVGAGLEESRLRAAAGPGVRFLGPVDDVLPYLHVADVFVLPSVAEGLSVALLEAMSAGLAVVATAVGGTPEAVDHDDSGWLIKPDSASELREALLCLFADPGRRARLGRCARQRVLREYGLVSAAEKLVALYERVLQKRA